LSFPYLQNDPCAMRPTIELQTEIGEVRVPRSRGRPWLAVIEPESRTEALSDARLRLESYRRECRKKFSFRLWNLARRKGPIRFMSTIELINLSQWEVARVEEVVWSLYRQLKLRRMVRFLFQDTWTRLDEETGEIVAGTENRDMGWDGDAWEMPNGGLVRVCVSPATQYPVIWDINRELSGHYLRGVTWFNEPAELFLYLAAHEMRHLWQFEHPKKLAQICRLLDIDDEGDADIYVLRALSRHRNSLK
jgi:hypothetical protein